MDRARSDESQEDIADALERAAALLLRHLREPGDLSLTSAAVLWTLRADGPVRLTALAAAAGVSQPSMSQLVRRLEGDNLATRFSDPEDGRGTLVAITDAGWALLSDRRRERRARLTELLRTLSAEDEARLALAMHIGLPILQQLVESAMHCRAASERAATPEGVAGHD
jgi:DNA-binding MarR family transcriptional regulator